MHLSLSAKLFFTGLTLTVTAVVLVSALTWWSLDRGFMVYLAQSQLDRLEGLTNELIEAGADRGLQWLAEDEAAWRDLLLTGLRPDRQDKPDPEKLNPEKLSPEKLTPEKQDHAFEEAPKERKKRLPPHLARLASRLALIGPEGERIAGHPGAVDSEAKRPLVSGERLLGWLALKTSDRIVGGIHSRFFKTQERNLVIIGVGTVLLAGLAALLLGRHLSRPITAMAETTQRLRRGEYEARASAAKRSDELGRLARDIDALAETLAAAEAGRKRWVQDTAHELRTPLSSLRAEIEALQDGIREPDEKSLARLHAHSMTLEALIDDLRQLAEADVGRLNLDLRRERLWPLVRRVAENQESKARAAGIEIVLRNETEEADLALIDQLRLAQVLRNLIGNSLAYSDPGGRLEIALRDDRREGLLILQFDDTPPAVPAEDLPHLFDRFFRVEASRSRRTGGRGLGLSICRAILEAHGGQISAEASPLGGLRILLVLPSDPEGPSSGRTAA